MREVVIVGQQEHRLVRLEAVLPMFRRLTWELWQLRKRLSGQIFRLT
ncbi:hypothetical protein KEH51_23335 [[Brevibacterium] frigoritolerans]|uniref:Uncharacterized protein n=1 Tax=Peribacillus frigoritolerans TaxID=450367 RepID=A0A941FJG7_9BACI|nr:hypothetical protein [Peribacillus frigoritolerans]